MTTNTSKASVYISILTLIQKENLYYELISKYADPRTTNYFMLRTPRHMLAVLAIYLMAVPLLKRLMKDRSPLNLRSLIIIYNAALVALSAYMCSEFLVVGLKLGYSFSCQPLDWNYKRGPLDMRMVNVNWLFFFSKIIELADTIFFLLRKKNNQVTFLHVYHHSTMVINWWLAATYVPIGQSFFVGIVNSFIHTLMYAYYALSSMGPLVQRHLWWKKYMTSLQLVQFVLVVSHTGNALYITPCDFPWLYNFITFYYSWSMLFLFLNFYYHSYISKRITAPTCHPLANGVPPHMNGGPPNGSLHRRKVANGSAKE